MMLAHAIIFGVLVFVTGVSGAGHTLCSQVLFHPNLTLALILTLIGF